MSMISVVVGLGQLPLNVTRHGGNEGNCFSGLYSV